MLKIGGVGDVVKSMPRSVGKITEDEVVVATDDVLFAFAVCEDRAAS